MFIIKNNHWKYLKEFCLNSERKLKISDCKKKNKLT